MSADKKSESPGAPPSADDLRLKLIEAEMEKQSQAEKQRKVEQDRLAAFADVFLGQQISEDELSKIRSLVMNAVKNGLKESMVFSFPSDLCTDSGRAINNQERNWPDTLQGKAKELFDRYQTIAKPQGYKLKAMIINYPDGMPGDVGFFLDWSE